MSRRRERLETTSLKSPRRRSPHDIFLPAAEVSIRVKERFNDTLASVARMGMFFPQRAVFGVLIGVSLPVAIKGRFASAAGLIALGFLASRLPRFRSLAMPDSYCTPSKGAVA